MTWKMFIEGTALALLMTIVVQNTNFLNADWCAVEIEVLRKQVSEIHTEVVREEEEVLQQRSYH